VKATGPTLLVLTNADRQFYPTLGPFLAKREVHQQLGGVPWDEDTKTWLVLKDPKRGVMGFVAVALHANGRSHVESLYLADTSWRRIASELVGHAADRYGTSIDLHAVVRRDLAYAYQDAGFLQTGETKQFLRLTRPATNGEK
jgi:hypothetical protein